MIKEIKINRQKFNNLKQAVAHLKKKIKKKIIKQKQRIIITPISRFFKYQKEFTSTPEALDFVKRIRKNPNNVAGSLEYTRED